MARPLPCASVWPSGLITAPSSIRLSTTHCLPRLSTWTMHDMAELRVDVADAGDRRAVVMQAAQQQHVAGPERRSVVGVEVRRQQRIDEPRKAFIGAAPSRQIARGRSTTSPSMSLAKREARRQSRSSSWFSSDHQAAVCHSASRAPAGSRADRTVAPQGRGLRLGVERDRSRVEVDVADDAGRSSSSNRPTSVVVGAASPARARMRSNPSDRRPACSLQRQRRSAFAPRALDQPNRQPTDHPGQARRQRVEPPQVGSVAALVMVAEWAFQSRCRLRVCRCCERRPGCANSMTTTTSDGQKAGSALRRNIGVLSLTQALFQSVQGMAIATTPLAALAMLGRIPSLVSQSPFSWLGLARDAQLATVPIFLAHLGLMCTTMPASLLMARIGRRAGFTRRRHPRRDLRRAVADRHLPAGFHAALLRLVLPGRGRRLRLVLPLRRRRCRRRAPTRRRRSRW